MIRTDTAASSGEAELAEDDASSAGQNERRNRTSFARIACGETSLRD
jgi:hypothetical protein